MRYHLRLGASLFWILPERIHNMKPGALPALHNDSPQKDSPRETTQKPAAPASKTRH